MAGPTDNQHRHLSFHFSGTDCSSLERERTCPLFWMAKNLLGPAWWCHTPEYIEQGRGPDAQSRQWGLQRTDSFIFLRAWHRIVSDEHVIHDR